MDCPSNKKRLAGCIHVDKQTVNMSFQLHCAALI